MKLFIVLLFVISNVSGQLCDPNTHSILFNGSSYISFPANTDLDITDKITVEAWIKVASFEPNYVQGSVVCKHGWSAGEKGYVLRVGGNGVASFAIAGIDNNGNPVGWKEAKSHDGDIQLNTWHHVAGTYDGNKLRIYVDGVQAGSKNFKGSIDPSVDYDLKIGRIADDNTADKRYFDGKIDEVRIWDDDLSRTTIEDNMDEQIDPATPHLIAYWQFNEGSSSTVTDLGSANCNGTLLSAQWDTDVAFTNGIARPYITSVGNTLVSSSLIGNQWNLNGTPIPGETGISIIPVTGGDYTVTADYGLGCIATSEVYQIVFTGIDKLNLKQLSIATLSPGIFQIVADDFLFKNSFVKIYDLTGNEIYASAGSPAPIDLSKNSAGLYLITLFSEGQVFQAKLVR